MLAFLLQSEEERTKGVIQIQSKLRTPILDPVARFFTALSDEAFIVGVFPILVWGPFCDGILAWHFCTTIGFTFTVGNILKNLTCKRRPLSPPAWVDYSSTEEFEFSMPSTHAINSMAMALVFACHCLFTYDHVSSSMMTLFWAIFPLIWSGLISISRVYLGAHAIPDVVAGLFLGVLLGSLSFFTSELIQVSGNFFSMIFGLSIVVLVMLYHPVDRSNALNFHLSEGTFDYTPTLLGVAFGSISARYFSPNPSWMCSNGFSLNLLFRYLIGVPISAGIYFGVRTYVPGLLDLLLKKFEISAHYIPYKNYKNYVLHSVRTNSGLGSPNPSPQSSLNSSLSALPTENQEISETLLSGGIEAPTTTNGQHNTIPTNGNHVPYSNPKQLLCYTRLWGKLILYTSLTWTVTIVVPRVFYYGGL